MKRLILILLITISTIALVGCTKELDEPNFDQYRIKETNYINKSKEYETENSKIDLHFFEYSYVSYVDVKDYLLMLDGVYHSQSFEFLEQLEEELLTINFDIIYEEETNQYQAKLDAKNDVIEVETLDFFDSYMQSTKQDYGEGLIDLEPVVTKGKGIKFDLALYDFDLIVKEELFLMPLVIANLIFNQNNYFDTYYNGEVIYGIDTNAISQSELKTMLKSQYNSYNMPEEIALYNYNYYTFIIDYFYGLKNDRNITSGSDFINKESFLKDDVSRNIFEVTMQLDDLHTVHISRGYYNNKKQQNTYVPTKIGTNVETFYNGMDEVQNSAVKHFGVTGQTINVKDYEYLHDETTLVIYLLGFDIETPKTIEKLLLQAKPTTRNVIIDLSLNTGGNLGAVLRMFTLMTNKEIWYHFSNQLDNESISYGVTGDKEALDQYSYFIKTSSVTFSAANLTANIAKELEIPVIGQKSSGGAAALSFFIFPDGSIINMSSNTVLSNSEFISIEKGVSPDHYLENLYDSIEIEQVINKVKTAK